MSAPPTTRASTVGSVVGSGVGTYDVYHWERMLNTNFAAADGTIKAAKG